MTAEADAGRDEANRVSTRVHERLSKLFKLQQLDTNVFYITNYLIKTNDKGDKNEPGGATDKIMK